MIFARVYFPGDIHDIWVVVMGLTPWPYDGSICFRGKRILIPGKEEKGIGFRAV